MSIPEDAMRAARASRAGASTELDALAASLEFTASQLQPALGELERRLGYHVDAASFALGTLASGMAIAGVDMIRCAELMPVQFAEFLARCQAMQGREVCGHRSAPYPSVTCGLDPGHKGYHAAGRLHW